MPGHLLYLNDRPFPAEVQEVTVWDPNGTGARVICFRQVPCELDAGDGNTICWWAILPVVEQPSPERPTAWERVNGEAVESSLP